LSLTCRLWNWKSLRFQHFIILAVRWCNPSLY